MDTNTQALDEIRRIASCWLTDLNTDASDAMRNIAGVLIGGPSSITLMPQVNVGMEWELVEQTTGRLADSMDEACRETSMALRPGLLEQLELAISQAEHKPGEWAGTIQSMGGICSSSAPSITMNAFPDENAWANFSYKRDAWLAVAAVNALPELIERVRGAELSERAADRKAEELQAEVDRLRARLEVPAIGGHDGIACRDETIRGQDEVIERLRAENAAMREAAKPAELFSDAAEARIDVIGQNGNDGEHYAPQLSLDEVLAAAAPDEVAEAMVSDEGWTEWKGHARPMVPFARVDLKLRDGSRLLGVKAGSYAWKWVHGHGDVDVIAYRLPRD